MTSCNRNLFSRKKKMIPTASSKKSVLRLMRHRITGRAFGTNTFCRNWSGQEAPRIVKASEKIKLHWLESLSRTGRIGAVLLIDRGPRLPRGPSVYYWGRGLWNICTYLFYGTSLQVHWWKEVYKIVFAHLSKWPKKEALLFHRKSIMLSNLGLYRW